MKNSQGPYAAWEEVGVRWPILVQLIDSRRMLWSRGVGCIHGDRDERVTKHEMDVRRSSLETSWCRLRDGSKDGRWEGPQCHLGTARNHSSLDASVVQLPEQSAVHGMHLVLQISRHSLLQSPRDLLLELDWQHLSSYPSIVSEAVMHSLSFLWPFLRLIKPNAAPDVTMINHRYFRTSLIDSDDLLAESSKPTGDMSLGLLLNI